MQRIPFVAGLTVFMALLHGGFRSQATPPPPAHFPTVVSFALDKSRIELPSEMAGQTDLLLLSFRPEQQKEIETWLPAAQALQHSNFNFRYYRLPVSNKENFIYRWWENSSMRNDDTDPETWHWIVPLYLDKRDFMHQLQIPSEKQVAVLLANREGLVLWRAYGPMNPQSRAALMAAAAAH